MCLLLHLQLHRISLNYASLNPMNKVVNKNNEFVNHTKMYVIKNSKNLSNPTDLKI